MEVTLPAEYPFKAPGVRFATRIWHPNVTNDAQGAVCLGILKPDAWKPPLSSFYCTYAKSWVEVKSYWALTITSAEKTALTSMLNTC